MIELLFFIAVLCSFILVMLVGNRRHREEQLAELWKRTDSIIDTLKAEAAKPIDLGLKPTPWVDTHPSAPLDPMPGPYDGSSPPAYEPRSAVYLRLKKGGLNLLQAALETLHSDCAYRSFGDFSCPDGPYTLYKAGMEWVKGPDSPIREIHIPVYHRSLNAMHIEEGPDGKPTEAGYQAWVKRALCEIYPKWALPESFEPPVLVEKGDAPAPAAGSIVEHLIKHGWLDDGKKVPEADLPSLHREKGATIDIKSGSLLGDIDSWLASPPANRPRNVYAAHPEPTLRRGGRSNIFLERRMREIAEKFHPVREVIHISWLGPDCSTLEAFIALPDRLSLEAAEKAALGFRREASTLGVPYKLVQWYAETGPTPWSDSPAKPSAFRSPSPTSEPAEIPKPNALEPIEIRIYRLLEKTHPMRVHASVAWCKEREESIGRDMIEARVVLPDAVSVEAAMESSRAFHEEASTFGVRYTLVQSFADGIRPARRTHPDAPTGEGKVRG